MDLARKHAVRYLHVCSCTNVADPFHMTLWEGVPLRVLLWMAKPKANVRRLYYWGHTTPGSERFQSSLELDRVLEDPPDELPVILAYRMNGQEITANLGGPVRMFVPGLYANKSVKWLQHIVLTNDYRANDTYAEMNNDTESAIKTQARFRAAKMEGVANRPGTLAGTAQVGVNGLKRVQFCVHPQGALSLKEDPLLARGEWRDAVILPAPRNWGGDLPAGELPPPPRRWPLRYTVAHWTASLPALPAGAYDVFCRTIDDNGVAQPMPRPLPRTGANGIHLALLTVRG